MIAHRPAPARRRLTQASATALLVLAIPLVAGIEALAVASRALALGVAYLAIFAAMAERRRVGVPAPVLFLVGFGLAAVASAAVSTNPEASLGRAVAFLALVACAFFAAERTDLGGLAAAAFVVLPLSLSALALILSVVSPSLVFVVGDGSRQLFLPLLSLHPNTLGAVVAIGVVVGITRAVSPVAHRWVWLAVLSVEIPVLLLTYSRSSLLDVIVGLLVFAAVVRRATPLVLLGVGMAVVAVATGGDILLSLVLRNQDVAAIEGLSGRRAIWEVALHAWSPNPFRALGYGEGAAEVLASSGLFLSYDVSTTDNFLLDALLETGPVGALMVLTAYVTTIRAILAARRGEVAGLHSRRLGAEFAAVSAMILLHALGSGGTGRFHVLLVLLVLAVVGLQRSTVFAKRSSVDVTESCPQRVGR